MIKNSKGFTLMEVVLVLSVLMIGLGIGLPAYNQFSVQKEEERFFQLLRNDIYYAQSEAYRLREPVKVIVKPELGRYEVMQNVFDPLVIRQFPPTVSFNKSSNVTEIVYWLNGSIIGPGTLRFRTSTGEKSIIVHLGKGRVVFSG